MESITLKTPIPNPKPAQKPCGESTWQTPDFFGWMSLFRACPQTHETVEKLGYEPSFLVAFTMTCAKQACRRNGDDDGSASAR
jgi:hypothetical protein